VRIEPFGPVRQVGYVVQDAEAAARAWTGVHGHGPWTVFRNVALPGRYRGAETRVRMHVALGYDERGTEIELIEVISTTPSPYQMDDGRPLLGVHHVAWFSEAFEDDLALARERGLEPVFTAGNEVMRVAYLSHPGLPGMLHEFIEFNDIMRAGHAQRLAAAQGWDGGDLIRSIDFGG
jgi:methylmalonyl-CoA/ethylmalonyl-CoA epimerase